MFGRRQRRDTHTTHMETRAGTHDDDGDSGFVDVVRDFEVLEAFIVGYSLTRTVCLLSFQGVCTAVGVC